MNSLSSLHENKALGLGVSLLTAFSVFGISNTAHSAVLGFQDAYAPSNWTLTLDNSDGVVNTSNAPNSISIISGNNGSGNLGNTDYTIKAVADGFVSFDWSFTTQDSDGPVWDPFGYLLNGNFTQLTDNNGGLSQSGFASFNVVLGDTFGFRANTRDNLFGASTTKIGNFSAPASVPEPSLILGLIGIGIFGTISKAKKKHSS